MRICRGSCFIVLTKFVEKMWTSSTLPSRYSSISTLTAPTSRSSRGRSPSCTTLDTMLPPMPVHEAEALVADRDEIDVDARRRAIP